MIPDELQQYAQADVYLLDQIFKGRIQKGMTVLDAACGSGRNVKALLALGCTVTGVDIDPQAIAYCKEHYDPQMSNFYTLDIKDMQFKEQFDWVICNALLHFAPDKDTWIRWADACWQQIKPGGYFFCRCSTRLALPDAQPPGFAYLADQQCLDECETKWEALRTEPLKTTLVERKRTMTTWVLRKP